MRNGVNMRPWKPSHGHERDGCDGWLCLGTPSLSNPSCGSSPRQPSPDGPGLNQGLGTWIVLLVMRQPCSIKTATTGWNANGVSASQRPPGMASWTQPCETQ